MEIKLTLNGERIVQDIEPDLLLIDFVRKNGCYSVKRGCDTSNCGLCTVLLNDKPVLSCSILAMRANGAKVVTLEGMQKELKENTKHQMEYVNSLKQNTMNARA